MNWVLACAIVPRPWSVADMVRAILTLFSLFVFHRHPFAFLKQQ